MPLSESELIELMSNGNDVRWIGNDDDDDNFGTISEIFDDKVVVNWVYGFSGSISETYDKTEALANLRMATDEDYS